MPFILSIVVLIFSISFFFMNRNTKLKAILISCICLDFASFNYVSFGTCVNFACFFFFLSEFKYYKFYKKTLRGTPIPILLIIMTIALIIVIFSSKNINNPITVLGVLIKDLLAKYFVIAYSFVMLKSRGQFKQLVRISFICVLIITLFGILTVLTGRSILTEMAGNVAGVDMITADRRRVLSTFRYPFDYGFTCNLLLIIFIYARSKALIKYKEFILAIICCFIGIIICGCRTIIVTTAISIFVYYLVRYKVSKSLFAVFGLCLCGLAVYTTSSTVKAKIDSTMTVFDSDSKEEAGSSSFNGRIIQYLTTLYYIQGHELLGRGYRFFIDDLGYNKTGNGIYDLPDEARGLLGLEGAMMQLLLERGIMGVAAYLIFYIALIIFSIKLKKISKAESAVSLSILIAFILYGNMTGELDSTVITLYFVGVMMKLAKINNPKNIASIDKESKHLIIQNN